MRALACVALAVTLGTTACTFLLTAAEQCKTDGDCDARGGELAGRACVDSVCRPRAGIGVDASPEASSTVDAGADTGGPFGCADLPKPVGDPTKSATLVQPIYNVVTGTLLTNVTTKLCSRVDPNCASPVQTVVSDDKGVLTAKVFQGFEGFFELKNTEIADSLIMSNPSIYGDATRPPVPLPTKGAVEFYAQQVTGSGLDTTVGAMLVRTSNCQLEPLRGLTATLASTTAKTKLFFVYNNTPRSDVDQTNEEGALGFFNVPVGTALLTMTEKATGKKLGQTSVVIRAGYVSLLYLTPSL